MILGTVAHGRSRRDTANLVRHLEKDQGQTVRLVAMDNIAGRSVREAVESMEILRDGSNAQVAFHHITLSPQNHMSDDQRDAAVARIIDALGAADHGWILVEHSGKKRATAGGADHHFHLILSHVGPDLKALDMGGSYARLEAVARGLELDMGEDLTQTRRHAAVAAQAAAMGRDDVAEAIRAMHPVDPDDLARSAMSSTTRQRAERHRIDLPKVRAELADLYARTDGPRAFRAALADQGLALAPGAKDGVWMVMAGDTPVGALDRLVKAKRRDVAAWIETEIEHDRGPDHEQTETRRLDHPGHDEQGRVGGREDGPGGASGEEGFGRDDGDGQRHLRLDRSGVGGRGEPGPGGLGTSPAGPAPSDHDHRADRGEDRPDRRAAAAAVAVAQANANPTAQRLLDMARDIAIDADRAHRPMRTMVARLDAFEEKAIQKAQEARTRPSEPARVKEATDRADEAQRAARRARGTEQAAEALVEQVEAEKPRGLIAWITGKTARHRDELAAAQQAERQARDDRKAAEQRALAMDDVRRSVARKWDDERSGIERQKSEQAEEARRDLEWTARARSALHDDPALAADPKALQARIEEMAEEAREAMELRLAEEAERQRRHDLENVYRGPSR